MTAIRIEARRALHVTWARSGKVASRQWRPGEYEAEERRMARYRTEHGERLLHAERCQKGDQFRGSDHYYDYNPDHK